jgi:hypothetical protein
MGGLGSGSWYRHDRKSTVEESLTLAMQEFGGRIFPRAAGTFTWTWSGGNKSSIGYRVTWGDQPIVTLHYCWRDSENVKIPIRLQTTPTNFTGKRWWFTCPLIVDEVSCKRRVGKVYLPPGSKYFGCRQCHNLTYRSCQEAHQMERMFSRLGEEMEYNAEIGRLLNARIGQIV